MAFRSKEAILACGFVTALWSADARVEVRHDHLNGSALGTLTATEAALRFDEPGENAKHGWTLAWSDIQQLWIAEKTVRVRTYVDTWWKAGADRGYELHATPGASFAPLYAALRGRLDQRLVGAIASEPATAIWKAPAKLRVKFGGPEGVLYATEDGFGFDSPEKEQSRAWRLQDIENIASSGPFSLTVTTFEGNGKSYHFQLKRALQPERYNQLWRRLNRTRQLDSIQEQTQ